MEESEELLDELRQLDAVWQQTNLRTPFKTMLLQQRMKMLAEVEKRNARLHELVIEFYQKKHWQTPHFYEALEHAASKTTVKLRVPETLLKKNQVVSLLISDHYGVVRVDKGLDAEQKFFSIVQSRQKEFKELRSKRLPYYIHIQGSNVRHTTSSINAAEMSRNSGDNLHILQRYIPPLSSKVSKMRVYWDKRRNAASYTVISKKDLYQSGDIDPEVRNEPYSVFARSLTITNMRPQTALNSTLQVQRPSTSTNSSFYSVTQDERPSSFSQLRSRSLPKRRTMSEYHNQSRISKTIEDFYESAWLVFSSNLKHSSILENKSLTSIILGALSNAKKVAEHFLLHSPFSVLIVDFMKETDGKWVLISCKGQLPQTPIPSAPVTPIEIEITAAEPSDNDYTQVDEHADFKPVTFRSFYKLEEDETKRFNLLKEELETKAQSLSNTVSYIDLKDVKTTGVQQYGKLLKRTKSGRVPKRILSMTPSHGKNISTKVIYDSTPQTLLDLPPHNQQFKNRTVRNIMDKLTRKMDSSLHNARHGAKSLKIAGTLNHLKSTKGLSIMRAFETSILRIKEHKVMKRYFDQYPDLDVHVETLRAFPCIVYDSKGLSGKALNALHKKIKLTDEVYNYFMISFLNCLRLEGFKQGYLEVLHQRLEYFRPMIVSSSCMSFPSFISSDVIMLNVD
mmetsp:Transcript_32915/g.57571  ORF Transcript_32915/g.57571 Transcript_32915/m.57571 type:complete len:679 (+) Transcript_32915:7004-9040(+)